MIDINILASSSKGNCYVISDGYTKIMLECGIAWKKIQVELRFKTSELAACLVSHSHADHSKAAKDVIKAGIDLYCSKGTAEAIGVSGHRVYHTKDKQTVVIGTWQVLPFDTVHDAPDPQGFLLVNNVGEKLLFLTDSSYCKYRFTGLTHLMVEANFSQSILDRNIRDGIVEHARRKRLMESHFSIERVLDLLDKNDISRLTLIHLLHLSSDNADEELFKRSIQQKTGIPVVVAKE